MAASGSWRAMRQDRDVEPSGKQHGYSLSKTARDGVEDRYGRKTRVKGAIKLQLEIAWAIAKVDWVIMIQEAEDGARRDGGDGRAIDDALGYLFLERRREYISLRGEFSGSP